MKLTLDVLFGRTPKAEQHPAEQNESKAADTTKTNAAMNIHHLIVLDESGSMSGVTAQTISGCNETLQTIRQMQDNNAATQRHYVSIYAFDSSKSRYIVENKPIGDVRKITGKDYRPCGSTPLFDAMGYTLLALGETLDKEKGKETMGYITIITDGYENASHKYTIEMVQQLIDELKQRGVVFSFIGANIDAAQYAGQFHIDNALQFEQSAEGTQEMWERERLSKMRSNARMEFMRKHERDEWMDFGRNENMGNYYAEMSDANRITPERITHLHPGEVFVFGSDNQGRHRGGAAGIAVARFGAVVGQAEGLQGSSYAIPTVGVNEEELYFAVKRFCEFAAQHPELTFLVTPVGCGNAGWPVYTVAPMFRRAAFLNNVKLPKNFWDYINE